MKHTPPPIVNVSISLSFPHSDGTDNDPECSKSHSEFITKNDLREMEQRIMSKLDDLIQASATLSTASDALSVKLDALEVKVDAVVAALQNADLPPAGVAALAALKASTTQAAAAGDKVDAEVAKLDTILPTPAPAAPTA